MGGQFSCLHFCRQLKQHGSQRDSSQRQVQSLCVCVCMCVSEGKGRDSLCVCVCMRANFRGMKRKLESKMFMWRNRLVEYYNLRLLIGCILAWGVRA